MYLKKFNQIYAKIIAEQNDQNFQNLQLMKKAYLTQLAQFEKLANQYDYSEIPLERQIELIDIFKNALKNSPNKEIQNYAYDVLDTISMNDMQPEVQVQMAKLVDDDHIPTQLAISLRSREGFEAILNYNNIIAMVSTLSNRQIPLDLIPQYYQAIKAAQQQDPDQIGKIIEEAYGVDNIDDAIDILLAENDSDRSPNVKRVLATLK